MNCNVVIMYCRSHPAASLQFYLNGNRVKEDSMGEMEIFRESDGILQSSFRKMRLLVKETHSQAGVVNVKCNANIGEAYWQTSNIDITVISSPSYMLESRSHSHSGNLIFITLSIVKHVICRAANSPAGGPCYFIKSSVALKINLSGSK